jgi:hypothetical protein
MPAKGANAPTVTYTLNLAARSRSAKIPGLWMSWMRNRKIGVGVGHGQAQTQSKQRKRGRNLAPAPARDAPEVAEIEPSGKCYQKELDRLQVELPHLRCDDRRLSPAEVDYASAKSALCHMRAVGGQLCYRQKADVARVSKCCDAPIRELDVGECEFTAMFFAATKSSFRCSNPSRVLFVGDQPEATHPKAVCQP